MDLVSEYHQSMSKHHLHLIYEGEIDQTITKAFITLAEKNLEEEKEARKLIRRVYHIMVEFLQNIYKHADERGNGNGKSNKGIFMLGKVDEGYVIVSGNAVKNDKLPRLREMLEKVNLMSLEELKEYYKSRIRSAELSEKGGAGLGFIDIVRRTGNKLEYRFENIDDLHSFFILKTYIAN